MSDDYVCTLSEASIKKAREELFEDPDTRLQEVEKFRQWIKDQPHLEAYTGTEYLLKYLRGAKFNHERAHELLENNLAGKLIAPEFMVDIQVDDKILDFLKTGYMLPLPKRDKEGRKIMICRGGAFDPSIHEKEVVLRSNAVASHYLLRDEETQVNGLIYVLDLTGFSLKHQCVWGFDDIRKMLKIFQSGVPGRFKGFHFYNLNVFFEVILQLMLPLLTKKFRNRITFHGGNLESLYDAVSMECLPIDYLPDDYEGPHQGEVKDILADVIREISTPEFRESLADETSNKFYIDESKRGLDIEKAASTEEQSPTAKEAQNEDDKSTTGTDPAETMEKLSIE